MPVLRRRAWMYCALFMAFGTGVACAQQFPNQTIRIIAGAASGGGTQGLTEALGQQTIVENRGSAGGVIAVQTVTKARPDGYTLLLYGSNVWLWQFMVDNVTWDPMRDLAPITLAISAPHVLVIHPLLPVKSVADLIAHGAELDAAWLRAGFLLALVGYGTKMGLAPLHSWLPDAHGEAPATISALLSGAVLNAAFLAILRAYQICSAAGLGAFAGRWLIALGLVSMAIAGVFILGQRHFKRLLAYSSVEHMGILAVALGLGGAAAYSTMLHVFHHVLYKGSLFFIAGLVGHLYGSYQIAEIRGVLHRYPLCGVLLLGGMFAILGLPPFGLFYSELGILFAAGRTGHWW
ncbi:MAG: hypothetical protein HYU44_18970, partial [Betaproteobacteria bacterium]|nr:hypothetical protein [Betaproteobacteria bacterium]